MLSNGTCEFFKKLMLPEDTGFHLTSSDSVNQRAISFLADSTPEKNQQQMRNKIISKKKTDHM